jgi:metal-dependent HD superfamily phosphatase/phosphodiesterase
MQAEEDSAELIEAPSAPELEREARLTPGDAIAKMRINLPWRGNRKLRELVRRANADPQLRALWHVANVNAVKRLEINDHSWVHIQIVSNIALKLLRQLVKAGVTPAMVGDYGMEPEDSEVVVVCAALLHCVGMSIHRDQHEELSLLLAEPKARELLAGIYDEPALTILVCEVLQAIITHREDGRPLTLEAGTVRVSDALDMAKGRSRIPFERGQVTIHSLSAAAIETVSIRAGEERPVLIEIEMNNSSGIFQVDQLLKAKLRGSGLEPYLEVIARIDTEAEKRLVPIFRLEV